MGPERKAQLQSPVEIERRVQETTALVAQSARLMVEMDELLKRAKALLEQQSALVDTFKDEQKK